MNCQEIHYMPELSQAHYMANDEGSTARRLNSTHMKKYLDIEESMGVPTGVMEKMFKTKISTIDVYYRKGRKWIHFVAELML